MAKKLKDMTASELQAELAKDGVSALRAGQIKSYLKKLGVEGAAPSEKPQEAKPDSVSVDAARIPKPASPGEPSKDSVVRGAEVLSLKGAGTSVADTVGTSETRQERQERLADQLQYDYAHAQMQESFQMAAENRAAFRKHMEERNSGRWTANPLDAFKDVTGRIGTSVGQGGASMFSGLTVRANRSDPVFMGGRLNPFADRGPSVPSVPSSVESAPLPTYKMVSSPDGTGGGVVSLGKINGLNTGREGSILISTYGKGRDGNESITGFRYHSGGKNGYDMSYDANSAELGSVGTEIGTWVLGQLNNRDADSPELSGIMDKARNDYKTGSIVRKAENDVKRELKNQEDEQFNKIMEDVASTIGE